ncbi:hypothetical protein [Pseudoalteromonas ruthenica]|uniref:Uncharacterized protein n=2 Tax=Pseudoalteromonas TaxID=53246 RepID=A0A0F4PXE6_9GAMM|nr:hypothetical protein [Pseudoalteromonas ruthenica]KJY98946.1 hypothetical protein TW76_04470 [Pseudoalteromonas ruthenica]KJZ01396.1 hypothetical protein TW72_03720 [Pseudoalteromonas ruthenica]
MHHHISFKQDEGLRLQISQSLLPKSHSLVELYLCIPNEMGINPNTLSEESFYHNHVKTRMAYNASGIHLPLVRSRFISKNRGDEQDYRQNLNLYCYQVRLALDTDVNEALAIKEPDAFFIRVQAMQQETERLLKRLRRYKPKEEKLLSFFYNADNFLSWHAEQVILKLLDKGPKSSEHAVERKQLLQFCEAENGYREQKRYNSVSTVDDPNRLANKMHLLQRLIEHGVVLRRETRNLNTLLRRFVKGSVTAIMMAFVMLLVLTARTNFTQVTIGLVALLGTIYGLREIFKEDITRIIWRRIIMGRAKWLQSFYNSTTKVKVAKQKVWLEYIKPTRIPKEIAAIFSKRRQQNKQAAQWMYMRFECDVPVNTFMPGYDALHQSINISMAPMVRYLRKGEGRVYEYSGKKIRKHAVERRYQINVVLVTRDDNHEAQAQRYKITLNRSQIVALEKIGSPSA